MNKILVGILMILTLFLTYSFTTIESFRIPNAGAIGPFLNAKFSASNSNWKIEHAFSGIEFDLPIRLKQIPGSENFLLTEKNGRIVFIERINDNYEKQISLDITSQVFNYSDAGMYGFAFHPEFGREGSANRDYIYVMYNYLPQGLENSDFYSYYRLSRFSFDFNSNTIDPTSETVLIQHFDRDPWHNGGAVLFDNQGFLNFSVGDEGGANDQFENGQEIEDRLFGGIFRIDVDNDGTKSHPIRRYPEPDDLPEDWPAEINENYSIPNTNPWVSSDEDWLEEYLIIGLRNPHSVYYHSESENYWIADVGQNQREEISVFRPGDNGQWPYKEGTLEGPEEKPDDVEGHEKPPIYEYDRDQGGSIIGGFVYTGELYPELKGDYLFGDYLSYDIWALDTTTFEVTHLANTLSDKGNLGFVSFSTDIAGNIYLLEIFSSETNSGKAISLNPPDQSTITAPYSLSELGAFTDLQDLQPIEGFIRYELNSTLFSDNALKDRWVAIPNNGSHNSMDEQVVFSATDNWQFPDGTVFIKHFELPIGNDITKRLETRFLIISDSGSYGLTYKWNDEGTDAYLLNESVSENIEINTIDDSILNQTWTYPDRTQCLTCHNANAGAVLGLSSHNMNKENAEGVNQIESWNMMNLFLNQLESDEINKLDRTSNLKAGSTNQLKVRSYLDTNCSFCHRPNGVEESDFDARFITELVNQKLINQPTISRNSLSDNFIISPGDTSKSEILRRIHTTGEYKMPPLGRNIVDTAFSSVLKKWILELTPLSSNQDQDKLDIYPNPSDGNFSVSLPKQLLNAGDNELVIRSINGQMIYKKSFNNAQVVNLNLNLSPGVYLVSLSNRKAIKIVIE